jgi:hypothetical protein
MFVGFFNPMPTSEPSNDFYSVLSKSGTGILSNNGEVLRSGFYGEIQNIETDEPKSPGWNPDWGKFSTEFE